jgi:Raf kinase inhibitor-like YbhB/YbcL family protein
MHTGIGKIIAATAAMSFAMVSFAQAPAVPPAPAATGGAGAAGAPPAGGRTVAERAPMVAVTLVPDMNAAIDLDVPGGLSGPLGSIKVEYAGFGMEDLGSPPLKWTKGPAGTRSFVLILQDMPATREQLAPLHWAVYNIPGNVSSLRANIPEGETIAGLRGARQLKNSLGFVRYLRPGPPTMFFPNTPPGAENELSIYTFQLFALDTVLSESTANLAGLVDSMRGHVLAYGIEHIVLQRGKPKPQAAPNG